MTFSHARQFFKLNGWPPRTKTTARPGVTVSMGGGWFADGGRGIWKGDSSAMGHGGQVRVIQCI